MGRKPGNPHERKYKVQHLWGKHRAVIRYIVLGLTNKQIAQILKCTPQNVSDIRNSPIVQREINSLQAQADAGVVDVREMLEEDAIRSVDFLRDVREGELEGVTVSHRISAAKELLDRTEVGAKVQKHSGSILHGHLTREDLNEIVMNAQARAQAEEARRVEAEVIQEDKEAS